MKQELIIDAISLIDDELIESTDKIRQKSKRTNIAKNTVLKHAVAIVMCVCLIFGTMMSIPTVRAAVVEVIVQWFEQFTKFASNPEIDNVSPVSTWAPQYLPEGYQNTETLMQDGINQLIYSNANGNEIVFTYVTEIGSISVNNEKVTYRTETHGGIMYQIFESQEVGIDSSIVWDMNGYGFLINGNCPVDELVKMAVSVK